MLRSPFHLGEDFQWDAVTSPELGLHFAKQIIVGNHEIVKQFCGTRDCPFVAQRHEVVQIGEPAPNLPQQPFGPGASLRVPGPGGLGL
jgi:hypothetical protein